MFTSEGKGRLVGGEMRDDGIDLFVSTRVVVAYATVLPEPSDTPLALLLPLQH